MSFNDEIKNAVEWDVPGVDMEASLRTAIQTMVETGPRLLLL